MSRIGLTQQQVLNLVDALRRNLLYQTVQPVFLDGQNLDEPDHVIVKIRPKSYEVIMNLIGKAGGWTLPAETKREIEAQSDARRRLAFGNGTDFNFAALTIGDLYAMYEELGVADLPDDLNRLRVAVGEEIKDRQREAQTGGGEQKT